MRRSHLAWAIGLVAVGAALRLYGLNQGLWVDEVMTLVDYVRPPLRTIVTTYDSQNQHVLYSILAHLSVSAFGENAWSLRLPAALFGIATLWSFWRLARLLTSEREALLATAMLTFSYQQVWFSQNARGYSALLFWTILSTSFLIRGLRGAGRGIWIGYAVSAALGMYTHMTMVFVMAGQFVAYAWEASRSRDRKRDLITPLLFGFVPAGLLTVALYSPVLTQIPAAAATDLSNVSEWRSPAWLLAELGRSLNVGPLLGLVALGAVAVLAAGLVSFGSRSLVLPIVFLVPVVLGGSTMIALGHHLWPRFFFFAAGFGILVAVRGLTAVTRVASRLIGWTAGRSDALATAVTVLAILVLARSLPYVYRPKQDYAGARDFVEGARQAGDAVVAVGVAKVPFRIYYAPDWQSASTLTELDAIRASHARTWLVYTLPIELANSYPDIDAAAHKNFRLVREFDGSLNGGTIFVCRADGSPGR